LRVRLKKTARETVKSEEGIQFDDTRQIIREEKYEIEEVRRGERKGAGESDGESV
jgi:hypothetical protein